MGDDFQQTEARGLPIFRYEDPANLPPIGLDDIVASNVQSGIVLEVPGQDRKFLRYAPEFIDDPDSIGIFHGLGAAIYTYPPCFVAAVSQAAVIGYRTILNKNSFFNDELYRPNADQFLRKLRNSDPFPNEDTALRWIDGANHFVLENPDRPRLHISGNVVVLCTTEPSNFGSFIFRVMPKILTLKKMALLDLQCLVYAKHPQTRELLELGGIRSDLVIHHETHRMTTLDRAIIPSHRNPHALLDHESRDFFRKLRLQFGSSIAGRRIYVSRAGIANRTTANRPMLNEHDLIKALELEGFETINPDRMTAREQIMAFSSADIIVGPSGAAMFNAAFCSPGTKLIDIESEPNWIYAHAGFFASCELRYGIFVGKVDKTDERAVHRRWAVNIPALVNRVRAFINS